MMPKGTKYGENDHGGSGRGGGEGHGEPATDGTYSDSHQGPDGGNYRGGKQGGEDMGGATESDSPRRTGAADSIVG